MDETIKNDEFDAEVDYYLCLLVVGGTIELQPIEPDDPGEKKDSQWEHELTGEEGSKHRLHNSPLVAASGDVPYETFLFFHQRRRRGVQPNHGVGNFRKVIDSDMSVFEGYQCRVYPRINDTPCVIPGGVVQRVFPPIRGVFVCTVGHLCFLEKCGPAVLSTDPR